VRGPHYPAEAGTFEDGTVDYDRRDPGYLEVRPRGQAPRKLSLPAMISPRVVLLESFIGAVQNGTDIPISGHNNLLSVAMMVAAVESASRGEAVLIPPI
jgi:hypothetical protein